MPTLAVVPTGETGSTGGECGHGTRPLPLGEHARMRVTISPVEEFKDPLEGLIGICDGPEISGAERHDEIIYGLKRPSAKKP